MFYTTIIKSIKGKNGLENYYNYLISNEHNNHKEDEIINFLRNKNFINNCNTKLNEYIKTHKKTRIKDPYKSLMFSLPPNINLTVEQWKTINKNFLNTLLNDTNFNEIDKEQLFFNIHNRENKNSHFNLILSQISKNNNYIDLSKKKYLYLLKKYFSEAVNKFIAPELQPKSEKELLQKEIETLKNDNKDFKNVFIYLGRMIKAKEENDNFKYEKNKTYTSKIIEKQPLKEKQIFKDTIKNLGFDI